jgi:peptidoglycan hydrolase-like protein with peptidoglycan-binding domain
LAEKIRLDAAEIVINNYINSDVERFNGFVANYNSRCGEFRYRQGALESARRDVEPYRAQIQLEGRVRFVPSPTAKATAPTASRLAPDPMVEAVQLRLQDLGYEIGNADGLFGGETRAAIQAFQRNRGLSADGVANAALLRQLEVAVPQNRKQNSNANSTLPSFSSTSQSQMPANSWVSGSTWYCNDGYRKIGDRCEAFKVPANSWVSGSTWYCNDGYRKIGDRCEAFKIPANSWVSGSTWYCNDGYRKIGDRCEAFEAPANSWVSGSIWYCNDGYRKVGDKCVFGFK